MEPYEKLGVFYLGRLYDLTEKKVEDELLLYDSNDLLTHAFCVGMTGSGKTGLCISLLEEAAVDGIPALVIDPKGDLTNLMLTFPNLSPSDFRPWVNEDAARQRNMTPDDFASAEAETWRKGLEAWAQSGDRIRRLKESADFAIYTPGSDAGLSVSILSSFAAPPEAIASDHDLLTERIGTTVTSLLALLGIDADPIRSREHILISTILQDVWGRGQSFDLGGLIHAIQNPPVSRIGVLELEAFYPSKDRFVLAMALNNLLASPAFETWLTGEALDIDGMLYTPTGKPRISIFSIAHLSESERMFFVSLLLNETLGWMRTRPGTSSLRALLYMDEIFGYIPPVANPPSKLPMLTLLKQARAFGLGVVLATQNPVDLDYKGLSNTGTWFIGRLQTDRDKQRVLDGLEGASAGSAQTFDRAEMEEILAGLGKRVFLMHNVHENEPVTFHTRWAMSYLAGPMTRGQIKTIMEPRKGMVAATTAPPHERPASLPAASVTPADSSTRPVLPPDIPQAFLPLRQPVGGARLVYRPGLLGVASVHYVDTRRGIDHAENSVLYVPLDADAADVDWTSATRLELGEQELEKEPAQAGAFGELPASGSQPRSFDRWARALSDALYRGSREELFESPQLNTTSRLGESERDFRIRLTDAAREVRDANKEVLRKKYASKFATLEDRVRRAELAVAREKEQAKQQKVQTVISAGATLLSAFLGRKATSRSTLGRATTAARGVGRSAKEAQDVERAQENVEALKQRLAALQAEFEAEIDGLDNRFDPEKEPLAKVILKPRRTDVDVRRLVLAWAPYIQDPAGSIRPGWQ